MPPTITAGHPIARLSSMDGAAVLADAHAPGLELVVASEVRTESGTLPCASAQLVSGALRRIGLTTRIAPVLATATDPLPAAFGADRPRMLLCTTDRRPRLLRLATSVLLDWQDALGARRVLLAGPRSFCAGVERAIEIVERALHTRGAPIYVRKQIVHNEHVVRGLEQLGAVFVDELDQVPDRATVIFSAHGVSPAVRAKPPDADSRSSTPRARW